MTEHIDKNYVRRYISQARATKNPDLRNNYLYRAGTQMELDCLDCDGNDQLSPEQQRAVFAAADKLLGVSVTNPDNEHRPWLVMSATPEGFRQIARYRFRNDAEAHAQKLKRLCPTGYFTAAFEKPKVSSR